MMLDKDLMREAGKVRSHLALTVGLGVGAGLLAILQASYLARVVNGVFLAGQDLRGVWPWLMALLGIIFLRAGLAWVGEVAAHRAAARIKYDLRRRLVGHLLALGPVPLKDEHTGELVNVLVEGVEALEAYFARYLPQLALAALVPLLVLGFVFPLDLLSGLLLFFTAPLIPLFMVLIGRRAETLSQQQWQTLSGLSAHFLDVLQGLPTLKIFGRSKAQAEVLARLSDRFRSTTLGVLRVAFLSALVLELVATISTALVAVTVGLRLVYARIPFNEALFLLLVAPEFYLPLRLLGSQFHAGLAGVSAARRIFAVLDMAGPYTTPATAVAGVTVKSPANGTETGNLPEGRGNQALQPGLHIVLARVHYVYQDRDRPALEDVSLELRPGEKVALVGPSGGGKSTIAHLLLRFLEPGRGQITVNGLPLNQIPLEEWRRQVALVPQHPYLFCGTIADNILLGRPDASREEVVAAARLAGAHEFIAALPRGYDTPVGERGLRLSGGQARRLAIARAFLKDAPLLILDEVTAGLDPAGDQVIQAALERLMEGRTVLIIAHRLSTVYRADRIVVLASGRVVETGRHEDLMAHQGAYYRLVTAFHCAAGRSVARDEGPGSTPAPDPQSCATMYRRISPTSLKRRTTTAGTFIRLLGLIAPFWKSILGATLLGFFTVASNVGLIATAAFLIASAALHPPVLDLMLPIVGVRFFGISRAASRYLERYVNHSVTLHILSRLRVSFYQALEPLAPARLPDHHSGDLLSRVVADVATLENFYLRVLAPPLVALLVMVAVFVFLAHFAVKPALAWLLFFLGAGIIAPLGLKAAGRSAVRQQGEVRAALNAALVDTVQGMPEILAFGRARQQQERIAALSQELLVLQGHEAWRTGLAAALTGLAMNLALWSVLGLAIPLVDHGQLDGIYLAMLALGAAASFEAVLPLPMIFEHLEASLAAARRLFALTDTRPAVQDPPGPAPQPAGYHLQIKGLRFRYAPGEPWVLDGIDFTLPEGGRLAIVGPSGAGKSTLVNLLLRFWDYEEGSIRLGGHELKAYPQEELRRLVAVVSQRTHLFHTTIGENLLLARPGASQEEIRQAARQARLHEFIQSLPRGYDTCIGEEGLKLSGGQRQRLAIARALLKNAPILVLDEATTGLDPVTEEEIMQAIYRLMAGRTTLIITHRLAGLEAMDEILVLDKGRVVQRGRHEELLRQEGLYRRMWELQHEVLL
ncbi:Vitamin B12 import ATP-binding protein BtuD [Neomoorella glycerini]|uniref:Vitamin B12 import ATP-binding protein BtuD n=1 Tax=Neomoorella glycerini TaxID=55779 RepID=A0A6I5ZP83_9FIRM|nr:thiol reductant ABC exporter subunit CydD [Moorella glycerini]QGP91341.1 Vitamin B12 import ATP-binding protein BtuD [Moorella glycerini]